MEVMAFVAVSPLDAKPHMPNGIRILTMPFTGTSSGVLQIAAPPEFGRVLSANIFACDPNDPQATNGADDALKELLNITSGLALSRLVDLLGSEPAMALPELSIDGEPDAFDRFGPDSAWLDAEGHPVGIRLRLNA